MTTTTGSTSSPSSTPLPTPVAGCSSCMRAMRGCKGLSPKENREVPPLRYDWAYQLKRERPAVAGHRVNGGIADAAEARCAPGPRGWRDAGTRGVSRSVPAASAGRGVVRWPACNSTLRSRGDLLRAFKPYVEAQLAQGRCSSTSFGMSSACSMASPAAVRSARCSAKARTSPARTGRWSNVRSRKRRHGSVLHDHPRH